MADSPRSLGDTRRGGSPLPDDVFLPQGLLSFNAVAMTNALNTVPHAWTTVRSKHTLTLSYDANAAMLTSLFNRRPPLPKTVLVPAMQAVALLAKETPKQAQGRAAGHLVVALVQLASTVAGDHSTRAGLIVMARSTLRQADASMLESEALANWLRETLSDLQLAAGNTVAENAFAASDAGRLLTDILERHERSGGRYLPDDTLRDLELILSRGLLRADLAQGVDRCIEAAGRDAPRGEPSNGKRGGSTGGHGGGAPLISPGAAQLSDALRMQPLPSDAFTAADVTDFLRMTIDKYKRELSTILRMYAAEREQTALLQRELDDARALLRTLEQGQ
jgi:hypothetical protein